MDAGVGMVHSGYVLVMNESIYLLAMLAYLMIGLMNGWEGI